MFPHLPHAFIVNAIINRIMVQRLDLLSEFGPEAVMQACQDQATHVGDVDEIGTSDVSCWVRNVEEYLKSMRLAA